MGWVSTRNGTQDPRPSLHTHTGGVQRPWASLAQVWEVTEKWRHLEKVKSSPQTGGDVCLEQAKG